MASDLLRRPVSETWKWWAALIVPPLVWGARLLAGWTVAEFACVGAWAGETRYVVIQTLIGLACLALVIGSGLAAVSALRSRSENLKFDSPDAYVFLGVSGVLSAVIFGLLIIVETSAVYMVSC